MIHLLRSDVFDARQPKVHTLGPLHMQGFWGSSVFSVGTRTPVLIPLLNWSFTVLSPPLSTFDWWLVLVQVKECSDERRTGPGRWHRRKDNDVEWFKRGWCRETVNEMENGLIQFEPRKYRRRKSKKKKKNHSWVNSGSSFGGCRLSRLTRHRSRKSNL